MNWKNEAIEKLRGYAARQRSLQTIPEEIRRLELSAQSIRSARTDGEAVKGGGSRREDVLLSNMVKRQELSRQLEDSALWCKGVERALETLSGEDQLTLRRFYIDGSRGSLDRLCQELCLEKSAAYYRRDKALRSFTLAMYGGMES